MADSNGKKLIEDCIQLLRVAQKLDAGGNRALYPVIIVFFGENVTEYEETVRRTLEDNWNNAEFLKYINIVKSGDGYRCRELSEADWSSDPEEFLEKSVVDQLATEEYVFEDKNRVKFEFILQSDDTNAKDYFWLMMELNRISSFSVRKTLYLMIDESAKEKKSRTKELLQYITDHRAEYRNDMGTIYLLSNYLKNGSMLRDKRLSQNYRLIADIILLGGNKGSDGNQEQIRAVYRNDCIKTAAYTLLEKPTRNITIVSLKKIMEEIQEIGDRRYKSLNGREFKIKDDLRKRLGIQAGTVNILDEIFEDEIVELFPGAEELRYLPYQSEAVYKELHKRKSVSWQELDAATAGGWSLFYQEYFETSLNRKLNDEKFINNCRMKIQRHCESVISYLDAYYGLDDREIQEGLLELRPFITVQNDRNIEVCIHSCALGEITVEYYKTMTGIMAEVLDQIYEKAVEFHKIYEQLQDEMKKEDIDHTESRGSIDIYYNSLVQNQLEKNGDKAVEEVFRLGSTMGELVESIKNQFRILLKERQEFSSSYEEELSNRLADATGENRRLIVHNELEQNIEGYGRLHWSNFAYINHLRGTYYLINKNAGYAKELDKNSYEYSIFHLNRTDCIEKIAIYDLDDSDEKDCDLIRLAGEV